jgi:hypothetical protein
MTIINNIEIDHIQYKRNVIKEAILNNDPIDDKLHVILVISNPCLYARRYILIKEFMQRMELEETDVIIYVVELAYKKQKFIITDAKNPRHLQLRTEVPIWHKENMINLGVQRLLPAKWKAMAWIDSDVEFDSPSWAMDTLKILNGTKDVVQLYNHCVDMDQNESAMNILTSFGSQYVREQPYSKRIMNFWHPGYAWACTRKAYEKMEGLLEIPILGSADNIMALCFIQCGLKGINELSTEGYKTKVSEFQKRVKTLRLGYVPGVIRHYFHGSKKNRRYHDRWEILLKYDFCPIKHLTKDKHGILIPSKECPTEMLNEIMQYFAERNEDEFYQSVLPKKSVNYDEIPSEEEVENALLLDQQNKHSEPEYIDMWSMGNDPAQPIDDDDDEYIDNEDGDVDGDDDDGDDEDFDDITSPHIFANLLRRWLNP